MRTQRAVKKTNLNKFLIIQIEQSGVEVKKFKGSRDQEQGASVINPLERLFFSKKIDREEFAAAANYQKKYELAQISHHARPSYDGTTISSAASSMGEGGPNQAQIDASRIVFKAKMLMKGAENYETKYLKNTFKIVDLNLPEILELIFEKQIAVMNVEKLLHLDRRTIQERIKKICKILLAN